MDDIIKLIPVENPKDGDQKLIKKQNKSDVK